MNDGLTGLELAKYIIEVRFITGVIKFLKDIGWIKQDSNGIYQMTDDISLKVSCSKIAI